MIQFIEKTRSTTKHNYGLFKCLECGREYETRIRKPQQVSCGCVHGCTTHGQDGKARRTPELKSYRKMKERCIDTNCKNYHDYGGRGITVCDRWLSNPQHFLDDMGLKPSDKHSLDRIDVNGPYSPENCRWATKITQARNTRVNRWITFNDETKVLAEWSEQYKFDRSVFHRLVQRGNTHEQALQTVIERKPQQ